MKTTRWIQLTTIAAAGAMVITLGCRSRHEPEPYRQPTPTESRSVQPETETSYQPAPTFSPLPEQRRTIRLGAWNIEWLGRASSRSDAAQNVAQTGEDIADMMLYSGADIIALSEIVDTLEGPERGNSTLDAAMTIMHWRDGGDWEYTMFPMPREGDQHLAVVWNAKRVERNGEPIKLPVPDGERFNERTVLHRKPWALPFRAADGLTDFLIVPIHLKADYEGDYSAHRAHEAKLLAASIPQVINDADVVIIGDSNMHAANETGIGHFATAGWRDLNHADQRTYYSGGQMDRIFVPKGQPEFAASTMTVPTEQYLTDRGISAEEFKRRYSDHYLIVCDMMVMRDDD